MVTVEVGDVAGPHWKKQSFPVLSLTYKWISYWGETSLLRQPPEAAGSMSWESSSNTRKHVGWRTRCLSSHWAKGHPDISPWKWVLGGGEAVRSEGTPRILSGGSLRAQGAASPQGGEPQLTQRNLPGSHTGKAVQAFEAQGLLLSALPLRNQTQVKMSRWCGWVAPLRAAPGGRHLGGGSSWRALSPAEARGRGLSPLHCPGAGAGLAEAATRGSSAACSPDSWGLGASV